MGCAPAIYYYTDLPQDVIDILIKDAIDQYDDGCEKSLLFEEKITSLRNSHNAWIPPEHWITGFIMHYVNKANITNFQYDLSNLDGHMQYTRYGPGETYGWHTDHGLPDLDTKEEPNSQQGLIVDTTNYQRKLSFSLQLSGPDDYEGGNLQMIDNSDNLFVSPRTKGALIIFDSRTKHRVCKVKKGTRRSLVGWVMGPRFK
jgi:PKHD-type hydroxylase